MSAQAEIPAIMKSYDLILWTLNHTARFPRHHRYSLGQWTPFVTRHWPWV